MKCYLKLFFVFIPIFSLAQSKVDMFFKPSDSLDTQKRNTVVIAQSSLLGSTLLGLSQAWYKNHEKSSFHFYNDNADWLQMDKVGHAFSGYQLSRASSEVFQWSGISKKQSILYGSLSSFTFLTTVEIFDGFSEQWGFSYGDVLANFSGVALYAGQELLWDEQRILLKFSFHTTPYASRRPSVLGENLYQQILKDYNGQTYWLSFNIDSFAKGLYFPKWLNLAIGYGAEGMITSDDRLVNTIFLPEKERFRQYYLSFDVDLTKIKTNSHFLKTLFSVVNTLKIPAPTFELNSKGNSRFHLLYF